MAGRPRGPVIFDPEKHCGQPDRQTGLPCKNIKGFHTIHKHEGKCWKHGGIQEGDKRLKHGLTSKQLGAGLYDGALKGTLRTSLETVRKIDHDITDTTPEAELVRAIVHEVGERQTEIMSALLAWNATFQPAFKTILTSDDPMELAKAIAQSKESFASRPAQPLNLESLANMAERFSRIAEKLHKIKTTGTMTLLDAMGLVKTFQERVAWVIMKHIKDNEILTAICADIDQIDIPVERHRQDAQ
jgi:hypothetical protein